MRRTISVIRLNRSAARKSTSALLSLEPGAHRFAPIPRTALQILRQDQLVGEVVANHPLVPGDLQPVGVLSKTPEDTGCAFRRCRRGIERLPAIAGKIDLHPAVGVA